MPRIVGAPPNLAVFGLADAGAAALDDSVCVALLGPPTDGVDDVRLAEALADAAVFSALAITGPPGAQYLVAQPNAFRAVVARADQAPGTGLLKVIHDIGADAGLEGVPPHVSGADWRVNYYPAEGAYPELGGCGGRLEPHRHGPGGVAAMPEGLGNRSVQRAAEAELYVVQLCFVFARNRKLVLQRKGSNSGGAHDFTVDVALPPGLCVHAMGDLGTGRVRIASRDGGGVLLHGQSRYGLRDSSSGSVSVLRQVNFFAAAVFWFLVAAFVLLTHTHTQHTHIHNYLFFVVGVFLLAFVV
jgi:hypothetical protein